MKTVYTIHGVNQEKLQAVMSEMEMLGVPTIRVVDCGDYFQALEGTHRIAAAYELGVTPNFIVFGQNDDLDITEFDWFEDQNWDGTVYPAGEVAGELFGRASRDYSF